MIWPEKIKKGKAQIILGMIDQKFESIDKRGGITKTFLDKIYMGLKLAKEAEDKTMKDYQGLEF